jgi:hypothetical protein
VPLTYAHSDTAFNFEIDTSGIDAHLVAGRDAARHGVGCFDGLKQRLIKVADQYLTVRER